MLFKTKQEENTQEPEEKEAHPEHEPDRCPGCPNHCLLSALKCGKGRNLLKQKELMG